MTTPPPPLAPLVELIDRIAHPERIILFGSHARGDAGPDSDYDLLVILPDDTDRWQTSKRTRAAIVDARITTPTDLVFQHSSAFNRRRHQFGHLFWYIDREGVDLHAA